MPQEQPFTFKAGSTGRSVLVFAHRSTGEPAIGLAARLESGRAAYARAGTGETCAVALVPGRLGEPRSGSFVELGADELPGIYEFGVPDAMLAPGSDHAMLSIGFPGVTIAPVTVHLVAYDPQDPVCIGMSGLANKNRHEFLRRAMPRLTELELELGRRQEQELLEQRSQVDSEHTP